MPLLASKKLKTYLSISVGASATGAATLAEAEVLVWNGPPVTVSLSDTNRNIMWSVSTMTASISVAAYNPNDPSQFFIQYRAANYIYTANSGANGLNVTNGSDKALARLGVGDTIGPGSIWNTNIWGYLNKPGWTSSAAHPWATGTDDTEGFIGFFYAQGADRNYGWAQFTYDNGASQSLTLTSFAYETTPNTAITVQPVPEPTTLGLMVSGAAGIATLRRRRKKQSV